MPSAADRLEFGPPPTAASLRALGLALFVHALLIIALTWGVHWKRSDKAVSFEAELWSSIPQEAAPRPVEAPPPPPPPPTPKTPEVKVTPPAPDVDIALEREKKRKLQQQKEAEAKKDKEKELKAKEELAKRKAAEEAQKAEAKKQDAKDQAKQKQAEAAAEKQRQDNIRRIAGLAGATGSADAKGSAQKSSGPSASYAGKVVAKVKPNVVFTDDIVGNPRAEVLVTTTSDGTIISRRLVTSSGNKAWDEAVLKAIDRTGTMPRDIDGVVPTPMLLGFKPKELL
ncbi:MAG TPA: cell envelope integrity protein TolA [Polaromonas sp.]|jgi:colicin import membrane protein